MMGFSETHIQKMPDFYNCLIVITGNVVRYHEQTHHYFTSRYIAFFVFKTDAEMPRHQLTFFGQDEYGSVDGNMRGKFFEEKYLAVYVAPWCSKCGKAKPMIEELTKELRDEGVEVSVIVGYDSEKAVKDYAKKYPFPVLLGADKGFYNSTGMRGVPFFISNNKKGDFIKSFSSFNYDVADMRKRLSL